MEPSGQAPPGQVFLQKGDLYSADEPLSSARGFSAGTRCFSSRLSLDPSLEHRAGQQQAAVASSAVGSLPVFTRFFSLMAGAALLRGPTHLDPVALGNLFREQTLYAVHT